LGSRRIQQSEARYLGSNFSNHKPPYWWFRWHSGHYGLADPWAVGNAASQMMQVSGITYAAADAGERAAELFRYAANMKIHDW